jgi:hypothetical protein
MSQNPSNAKSPDVPGAVDIAMGALNVSTFVIALQVFD